MFEKLSDNLNLLMAKTRTNASELARRTGVPASTIKKIRNNDNPNPTLATLIPLAQNFMISVSQLVGDIAPLSVDIMPVSQSSKEIKLQIPLLNWEQIITWPDSMRDSDTQILSSIRNEYSKKTYAVVVNEEHWDGFTKGSILIVDPACTPGHHDYVIVHKEGQGIPVLRQLIYDESNIYLRPVLTGCNVSSILPQHQLLGVVMECRRYLKNKN